MLECRVSGSDSNAGGFNSARGGTDYSQQDSAVATGTVTSATTTVTATTAIFTSVMVGNYITDGTTWKEITAFTSTTVVTVDSAPSWTAATINVGGALASPGKAAGLAVAGNGIWLKAGTYTISSATANVSGGKIQLSFSGASVSQNAFFIGYTTTRGDSGGTRPTIIAGSVSSLTLVDVTSVGYSTLVQNIIIDGNSATAIRGVSFATYYGVLLSCLVKNCTNSGIYSSVGTGNNLSLFQCEVTNCTTAGAGINITVGGVLIVGCVSHGNTIPGFLFGAGGAVVALSASYANTGASTDGFDATTSGVSVSLINCVAFSNGRHGFSCSSFGLRAWSCVNCVSALNTGYGFSANQLSNQINMQNCAGYSNTSGNYNTSFLTAINFVTLTATPFTNAGSGDFSLNNTAGGGAACRAAGLPGIFPGGLTQGFLDIGAAQHADPAASGGIMLANDFSGGYTG